MGTTKSLPHTSTACTGQLILLQFYFIFRSVCYNVQYSMPCVDKTTSKARSKATPRPRLDGCKIKTKTNEIQTTMKKDSRVTKLRDLIQSSGRGSLRIWRSSFQPVAASVRTSCLDHNSSGNILIL